ncbi:MAG TPA: YihY/virulence factor BrkB family protein [Streptosporangiaceae bacterium]|nr:YihY/virulence factor BrkB family protein [Streptosporangiaceae bacterium]
MNPVERGLRRLDATQRKVTPMAFLFGVVKKYGDDNGGVLAANLTYSCFMSLFPLLLVLVTILGLITAGDPTVRAKVLSAVGDQIPIIGHTLAGSVTALKRNSVIGLIIGLVGLIWGSIGVAQAGLYTMEQVWNVPGAERPGFFPRLGRAVTFLGLLGLAVVGTTLLASLNTYGHHALLWVILAEVAAAMLNAAIYAAAFRILTPKSVATRKLIPGAVVGGVLYTALQVGGTYLVHHFLHSDSVYGVFATVLGLIAWITLAVQITIYSAEINVVLARRLWPRSILQPPLTAADRESLTLQALQNQRRVEEQVVVTFTEPEDADT